MVRASIFSLRRLTRLFYAMGVMMLVFGMLLSAVSVPVYAQSGENPELVDGSAGPGEDDPEGGEEGQKAPGLGGARFTNPRPSNPAIAGSVDKNQPAQAQDSEVMCQPEKNPTCEDFGYPHGFKIEVSEGDGGKTLTGGDGTVSASLILDSNGKSADWWSTAGIDLVIVKGGPGANTYTYDDAMAGQDIVAPDNSSGGPAEISHVNFCYDDITPPAVAWDCAEEDGMIVWVISNPNKKELKYTYTLSGGPGGSGNGTIAKNSSVTLTNAISADDQTLTVNWTVDGYSRTKTAVALGTAMARCAGIVEPLDLSIGWDCDAEEGTIEWLVNNPNEYAQEFRYKLDDGDYSEIQSVAGKSGGVDGVWSKVTDVPATGSQTLTIKWTDTLGVEHTLPRTLTENDLLECQPVPAFQDLGINVGCTDEETGTIDWVISNPNEEAIEFDYGISDSSGSIDSGEDIIVPAASGGVSGTKVLTNATSLTAQTLIVTWTDNKGDPRSSDETITRTEMETCEPKPLIDLEVSWICNDDGDTVDWRILNSNENSVEFTYSLTIGGTTQSDTLFAEPGQAVFLNPPLSTEDQVMVVSWVDGETTKEDSDTADVQEMASCLHGPPPVPGLTLEYICGYAEEFEQVNYKWRVTNPENEAVTFSWRVVGDDEQGTKEVGPLGSVIFETSHGKKTVQVLIGETLVTDEPSGEPCLAYLELSQSCNLTKGEGIDWVVNNPNDFELPFTFTLTGEKGELLESGSREAAINSVVNFPTWFYIPQTMTVQWETVIWGQRSENLTADEYTCKEDPPETPTPTQPTPTEPTPTQPTPTEPTPTEPTPTEPTPTEPTPTQPTPSVPGITQSTPVPTLPAPEVVADPELIPVTGVDFSQAPFGIPALALLQGLLINLGLGLLGIGLVAHGLAGYLSKR